MSNYLEWEDGIKFQVRENKSALVCSMLAIGLAAFIYVMHLLHPSGQGGALLYLPLGFMLLGGILCFVVYHNRKLIIEEMNICYVNLIGKEKHFTLDEIGYCKIGLRSSMDKMILYDLCGNKLCKLYFEMRGMAEFYQYLLDNGVRMERTKSKAEERSVFMNMIDALSKEEAICEEEIRKCSERFYEDVACIFRDWESRNRHFDVVWEYGFAEYTAEDLERKCPLHQYPSSLDEPMENLPSSYECVLEAYLKRGDEYVVTNRGETVSIMLPYLSRTKSYQIGEKTRIRKTDEESLKEWLVWQLEKYSQELPKHKYHTEVLSMGHPLRTSAGIAEKTTKQKGV